MSEFESEQNANVTETVTPSPENNVTPKKSKKKFLYIGIGAIVAAIVGVGVFFGIRMLKNNNPVKVTSNAIRGLKKSFNAAKKENPGYVELLTGKDPYQIDTTIDLELPNNMGKYKANILAEVDLEGEKAVLDITAKGDKEGTLAKLNTILDGTNLYFKLPDSMSNYYLVDITDIINEFKNELAELDTSGLSLFMNYDYTKIIDYLADAIDDTFKKDDFDKSSDEITVNGKDIKVNKYTTNISEKDLMNIVKNLLEEIKKDDDLLSIIAKSEDVSVKEVKESIDEFIEEMKDTDFDTTTIAKYSVYVSKTGKVVGYGFDVDKNTGILFASNNDTYQVTVKAEGVKYAFIIEKKGEGNYVISLDLGIVNVKLEITDKIDTIKKNEEYKETFQLVLTANINGSKLNGKLDVTSSVKKISSVNTNVTGAIDTSKMTYEQSAKFQSELERSSLYKTLEKFSGMFGLVEDSNDYNYAY